MFLFVAFMNNSWTHFNSILTPRILANYMIWRITKLRVMNLSKRFQAPNDEFRAVMFGVGADDARWRLCVDGINGAMDFATGKMYVKENFAGESKNNVRYTDSP